MIRLDDMMKRLIRSYTKHNIRNLVINITIHCHLPCLETLIKSLCRNILDVMEKKVDTSLKIENIVKKV